MYDGEKTLEENLAWVRDRWYAYGVKALDDEDIHTLLVFVNEACEHRSKAVSTT